MLDFIECTITESGFSSYIYSTIKYVIYHPKTYTKDSFSYERKYCCGLVKFSPDFFSHFSISHDIPSFNDGSDNPEYFFPYN